MAQRKNRPHLDSPLLYALVIDDDPVFCRIMEQRGEEMGVAVTSCGSIEELETLAIPEVFDVAIIDYYLDGLERQLKGPTVAKALKSTPAILVSRNGDCREDGEIWPFSVKRFISKEEGPRAIFETAIHLKQLSH